MLSELRRFADSTIFGYEYSCRTCGIVVGLKSFYVAVLSSTVLLKNVVL